MCQRNHVGDVGANGSAEPGPSREDYRLRRLLECGRERQPHRMVLWRKHLQDRAQGWLHGKHRRLSRAATCHWVGEVGHWEKREGYVQQFNP